MRMCDAVQNGLAKISLRAQQVLPAATLLFLSPVLMAQRATSIAIQSVPSTPSYTTPSAPGVAAPLTPVTLTVFVEDIPTQTGVLSGTVTFYDLHPLDRTLYTDPLGTASIQALTPAQKATYPTGAGSGTATLTVALGPGVHQITAIYSGTSGIPAGAVSGTAPAESPSTSSTYQLTIPGQALTSTYLDPVTASSFQYGVSSDGGNDEFTYTGPAVIATTYGYGMQYPAGSSVVTDQTVPTTYAPATGPGEQYSSLGQVIVMDAPAAGVTSFILADPFLAGVPSIVAFYSSLNAVYTIDLNRTQSGGSAATAIGCTPCTVAPKPVQGVAADLNADGLPDLVIAHNSAYGVGVMLNTLNPSVTTAQQTFAPEVTYPIGGLPVQKVVTGDFNGDGKPDIIALTNDGSNTFTILLNNGDGTFTPTGQFFQAGNGAVDIAVGDFNNSNPLHQAGFLDVVVLNQTDVTVSLFLGNGDGTFQNPTTLQAAPSSASAVPKSFAVSDLNRDGWLDLAILSDYSVQDPGYTYVGVSFLYGSSTTPLAYVANAHNRDIFSTNSTNTQIIATDLDGDGFPDIIMSNLAGYQMSPGMYQELGNPFSSEQNSYPGMNGYDGFPGPAGNAGTGIITPANAQPTFSSVGVATGDVNGDGLQDVVLMSPSNPNYPATPQKQAISVFLTTLYSSFVTPNVIATPAGPHSLSAAYTPATGSIYAAGTSGTSSGTLAVPVATLNPFTELDFNSVSVGTTQVQHVTLTNTGTGPLSVTSIALTNSLGNVFTESDNCGTQPFTLAASAYCTISIGFSPATAGTTYNGGTLTVTDNSQNFAGNQQTVQLNGSGASGGTGPAGGTAVTMTLTSNNYNPTYNTPSAGGYATQLNQVTLTATVVVTGTGAPVTGGTVTFYDNPGVPGSVAPDVIGTSTIQFGPSASGPGTATLAYAFGPGPHTLTATYSGTATYSPASAAAPNPPLVSNGSAAEGFQFTVYGVGDVMGVDLLGTLYYSTQSDDPTSVYAYLLGYGMENPSGAMAVTDATTGTSYPLSQNPYAGTDQGYFPFSTYPLNGDSLVDLQYNFADSQVTSFITADLFQNGVPAVVTVSGANAQLSVHLFYGSQPSSGDFQISVGSMPAQVVAADVNGDGILDLVIAHNDPATGIGIGVITSNFTPTNPNAPQFQNVEVPYSLANPISNIAVGDVNGDGINDIVAVTGDGSNLIYVLLNNGDGTFTATGATYPAGNGASQVALGDFNKDGKLDIGVLNNTDATIGILLGNGNGTFQTMVPYSAGTAPTAFTMADLNVDAKLDFAVANNESPTTTQVSLLYGNGDGTFTSSANPVQIEIPIDSSWPETNPAPTSIQAIDMNGDGCPDLMIGFNVNFVTMELCDPSTNQYNYVSHQGPDFPGAENLRTVSMAGADLNGDGLVDFLLMTTLNNDQPNPNQNGIMVQLTGAMRPQFAGTMVVDSPVGNHDFYLNYATTAASIYTSGSLGPMTLNIIAQTATLSNCNINFGYIAPNTSSAPATCTLTNTGAGTLQPGQINVPGNDVANFIIQADGCSGNYIAANTSCTFQVVFMPIAAVNYSASIIVPFNSSSGGLGAQATLIGTGIAPKNPLTVTAQSTSRAFATANPSFTYTITGYVNGDNSSIVTGTPALSTTATLNSVAGTYPITATLGTLTAPSTYTFVFVPGTLTVNGGQSQTITFPLPTAIPYRPGALSLTAHSSSGLPITYTITGPATIAGNALVTTGTGTVTVTASQSGNSTFAPATSVVRTFTVTP